MRPGFDARRRNRNIGTARSGHGQDNRLVVPKAWPDDRVFYEILHQPKVVRRSIFGREVTFLVEPPRDGYFHACTLDDIVTVLEFVPLRDRQEIRTIVLRQPTRKQEVLRSAWGRLEYWAILGRYSGPTVFLEAMAPGVPMRWPRSLQPPEQEELRRLRRDGHEIRETRRGYVIVPSLESIRTTQLYRTLPHEIGHQVHYQQEVTEKVLRGGSRVRLEERYRRKSVDEREAFAHRYADRLCERLRHSQALERACQARGSGWRFDAPARSWFGLGS